MAYPRDFDAACDDPATNTSEIKRIRALDAAHVVFELCRPDVAFLAKIAFPTNSIQDTAYLTAHARDGSYQRAPNGTGPYRLAKWDPGNDMELEANPAYWGEAPRTPKLEFRWSDSAADRAQALITGGVDGIDNPNAADTSAIEASPDLGFYSRDGLSTMYIGLNVTKEPWDDVRVRQAIAEVIDYEQLVKTYYPPGSTTADHFTPCGIPFGCEGEAWYEYNPDHARELLAQAGYPDGFATTLSFRQDDRSYLPDPPRIASAIAALLLKNLNVTATLDLQESADLVNNAATGSIDGLYLLGWRARFPDATDFLDTHFGPDSGALFGKPFDDIVAALQRGSSSSAEADRQAAYESANTLIKAHIPAIPVAHPGSGAVFKADVDGALASPIGNEAFRVMRASGRDTLVWLQAAEPRSLYCGDETDADTFRACGQIFESLYGYEVGGTRPIPLLASVCTASTDLMTWTCTLRGGVKFHDGSALDANDVVLSFAVQWDTRHALQVGSTGDFEYFEGLFGGKLNPAPPG